MRCRSFTDWDRGLHLAHHGIKGQNWGVRRGPPYPIEQKTMKKGTKLAAVSLSPSKMTEETKDKRWQYTYNPEDKWDSKVYKGPFSVYKARFDDRIPIYEHKYETTKDLRMPTSKERMDAFKDLYNKRLIKGKELKNFKKMMDVCGVELVSGNGKINWKKLMTDSDFKQGYEVFMHMMHQVDKYKSTKAYAQFMTAKYDAMVDDNNQGIYNDAHDPVIVFSKQCLKEIGDVKIVAVDEVVKNYKEVQAELSKQGKHIKL